MFSPLLVSCDDPGAIPAAALSRADALLLDLGDADGTGDRAARRAAAVDLLLRRREGIDGIPWGAAPDVSARPAGEGRRAMASGRERRTTILRVAPLGSGLLDGDLDAVMAGAPDALLLSGAVGARDLQHLAAKLAVREAERGLAAGRTRIVATAADTAAGVLALGTLPRATRRLSAVVWDPAALATGIGAEVDASPVRRARDLLLIAAAAARVPAFDRGLASDDLAAACGAARRGGFAGRIARRPEEVAPIAAAFRARA